MKYGVKNFIAIADSYVNAKTDTMESLDKGLSAWFCFTFNTTLDDPRLLDMTLEDLLVFYYMHQIKNDPSVLDEIQTESGDEYEEWIKKEMGEAYQSEEEMVHKMVKYDEEEAVLADSLPDVITTDLSSLEEKLSDV